MTFAAFALLGSAGCYGPPIVRPGHVALGSVERTTNSPWGHERVARLERRGAQLNAVAAERSYCRPFASGTLNVVDVESTYLEDDGRPLRPWDMILMLGGGAAALGFGVMPAILDEPYEDGYYAGIGIGVGLFTAFGLATLVPAALPNERRTEIVSQVAGGRWSGPPAACEEPRAVAGDLHISAAFGEQRLGWRFAAASGKQFAVPKVVNDSLRFWSDACQVPLEVVLQLPDGNIPPKLERVRLGERDEKLRKYQGAQGVESGPDAGAGHNALFGGNTARVRWTPGARIKAAPSAAVLADSARKFGEACLQKDQDAFVRTCRAKVRDLYRAGCSSKCTADGNAIDCNWTRDDCKALGGTQTECGTLYDRCMAEKGLDAPGLQRCADKCLDNHAKVKEGNRQCDTDWKKP